jgi:hypothetical protein
MVIFEYGLDSHCYKQFVIQVVNTITERSKEVHRLQDRQKSYVKKLLRRNEEAAEQV